MRGSEGRSLAVPGGVRLSPFPMKPVVPRLSTDGDKSFGAQLAGIWSGWAFLWSKRREWSIRALWRLIVTWRFYDSLDYLAKKPLYDQDLDDFEAAMTAECIKQGLPMVFIQPGAPGHKQAKSAAVRAFVRKHNLDAPYHPDHQRDF